MATNFRGGPTSERRNAYSKLLTAQEKYQRGFEAEVIPLDGAYQWDTTLTETVL